MVTTTNMSVEDPIEMIMMLQQRIEEMQQRHEAEMAVERAKCSAQIANKESGAGNKEEEERGKAAHEDKTEISSMLDPTWKLTERKVKGSKPKAHHAESFA